MKNEGKEEQIDNIENKKKGESDQNCNAEKHKNGNKVLKTIWNIISKLITIAILLICIIIVVQKVTKNNESFLGYRIFRVLTGSMQPKYMVGDVILVKEKDIDKIKIGDDVTYLGKEGAVKGVMITHRVIEIEEIDGKRAFHTQGIANNLEDPIIYGDQINGVVQFRMNILTLICKLVDNKYVFYFCGILPLTIYVCFKMFNWKSKEQYKTKVMKK